MFELARQRVLRFALQVLVAMTILGAAGVVLTRPNLIICRLNANESSAIAMLKNLHDTQQQFAWSGAIDTDGDGYGEFGTFAELCGIAELRQPPWASAPPQRLLGPALSPAIWDPLAGIVVRSGYCVQIWLSTAAGGWVGDGWVGGGGVAAGRSWCAYAWPHAAATARRAFFLDASGDVWATMNRDLRYCGRQQPVPVDAALPSSDAGALAEPGARVGRDGGRWFVVQ